MKKKLAKSKKKAGTSFKDKIIMVVSVAAITISVTSIVTRAAININPYPTNPSPLLVSDTIAISPTNPSSPLNLTATPGTGSGGCAGPSGGSCSGECACGNDSTGQPYFAPCVPADVIIKNNQYYARACSCSCGNEAGSSTGPGAIK